MTVVDVPTDCVGWVTGKSGSFLRGCEEDFTTMCFFGTYVKNPNEKEKADISMESDAGDGDGEDEIIVDDNSNHDSEDEIHVDDDDDVDPALKAAAAESAKL